MVSARKGVTLMELMIVLAIVSALFVVAAPILLQSQRHFILVRTRLELQQEARGIMYIITRAVRQAQSDSIAISRADDYQPFYSRISFVRQAAASGVPAAMVFQQEGTSLCQYIGGANRRVLSRNLNYLAFTFPRSDDTGILSVSVTFQKNIYEGKTKALHMASEKVRIMNE